MPAEDAIRLTGDKDGSSPEMSYYVLSKGYKLRGWKGLPFGLTHPEGRLTDFFDKEEYRVVYALDGRHDIDEDSLTENQKVLLQRLKDIRIAIPSDGNERLSPEQEYKSFPGMYKNSVQWSITGRCNYNCRHCFMSAPDYKGSDPTLEQCTGILDQLAENGINNISITGGEPLVSPHFYDILDEMVKRGMILDTIYSNGKLVDETLLDELEKRKMHPSFQISFDGTGWHDWLRGVEGAEKEAVRAFRLLQERGYNTTTSMCLHRHNIGDLRENVNLLASLGLSHIKMNVATPAGRWKNEKEHFISQDEAIQAVLDYIPQYVEDGMPVSVQFCTLIEFDTTRGKISIPSQKYGGSEESAKAYACGVVKTSMYISPRGRVLPCMTLGGTSIDPEFDSIFDKPLSDILSDSHYRDICLVKMGDCISNNGKCRDCEYRFACGAGCRACACGETGTDYKGIDEECCHFFKNGWYEKADKLIEKYKDRFNFNDIESNQGEHIPLPEC